MLAKDIVCLASFTLFSGLCIHAAPPPQQPVNPPSIASERALVDQYCVVCHSDKLKTGGLSLQWADMTNLPAGAETWEKVIRKVSAGRHAPARNASSRRGRHRQFCVLARNVDRPRLGRPSESRARHASPFEPHRIRQRRSRFAGPRNRSRRRCSPPTTKATVSTTSPTCSELRRRCWSATCRRPGT